MSHLQKPLLGLVTVMLFAIALTAVFVVDTPTADTAAVTYKIDKSHSAMLWKVKHMGVSYTHGRFNDFNGTFTVDDENLKNAKVEIDIDAASIDSNDEARDKHLRNAEYFDVEKHPSIGFESTAVTMPSTGVYRVVGKFSLHGVTKEVTFRMTKIGEGKDWKGNYRIGFEGQLVIKRSEYGMTTMLKAIGDDIHITLAVEAIRMGDKPAAK